MSMEELMKDEAFTALLDKTESLEDVAKLFKDRGFEVTVEQLKKAMEAAQSSELSEDSLEDVAGGMIVFGPVIGSKFALWLYNKFFK